MGFGSMSGYGVGLGVRVWIGVGFGVIGIGVGNRLGVGVHHQAQRWGLAQCHGSTSGFESALGFGVFGDTLILIDVFYCVYLFGGAVDRLQDHCGIVSWCSS